MVNVFYRVLVVLFFVLSMQAQAQYPIATASVDTTDYLIGDYIKYQIEIIDTKEISIDYPSGLDSLKTLELISKSKPVTLQEDGKFRSMIEYTFAGYDSGDVSIPQVTVPYLSVIDSTKLTVDVDSVYFTIHTVEVNMAVEPMDIKRTRWLPMDLTSILLYLVGVLVLVVVGYIIWKKLIKKEKDIIRVPKKPARPPHEIALEKLQQLEEKKLWQKGDVKAYHSEITEIVRRYFEERFRIPAMESTTDELLDTLRNIPDGHQITDITKDFLTNADMVKFAKFVPMASVNEEMMKQAYKMVHTTKRKQAQESKEVKEDVQS